MSIFVFVTHQGLCLNVGVSCLRVSVFSGRSQGGYDCIRGEEEGQLSGPVELSRTPHTQSTVYAKFPMIPISVLKTWISA